MASFLFCHLVEWESQFKSKFFYFNLQKQNKARPHLTLLLILKSAISLFSRCYKYLNIFFNEKTLKNELFYVIRLCFIFFINLEIFNSQTSSLWKWKTYRFYGFLFSLRSAPHNCSEAFRCWRGSRGSFRTVPD